MALAVGFAIVAAKFALPVGVDFASAPPCASAGAVNMLAATSAIAIFLNMTSVFLNLSARL